MIFTIIELGMDDPAYKLFNISTIIYILKLDG